MTTRDRFALMLCTLALSATSFAQLNCAAAENFTAVQNPQTQVSAQFQQAVEPGSLVLLWAPEFTPVLRKPVVAFSDDGKPQLQYSPVTMSPAHMLGTGGFAYAENAQFYGTWLTASVNVPNNANSIIACAVPDAQQSGALAALALSTADAGLSASSGKLTLPPGDYLLYFCVEAGASFMQPFSAGPGYSMAADLPNGACSWSRFYAPKKTVVQTSMSWKGMALHTSTVFAAVRLAD